MSNLAIFETAAFRSGGDIDGASGSGRWFRNGRNIVVLPAGEPASRRDEIEQSVGTISGSDYTKWVQRSLNRLYGLNLPTDGVDSSEGYRSALRRFNLEYSGRDYRDIDERTQNDLIYANEANESYVKWVIGRLNQVGQGPIPVSPTYTSKIRKAIKAFQGKAGLKVPGKSGGDGYVGSKTELALIKATGVLPPGEPRKAPPPKKIPARIKSITAWFNAFIPNNLVAPWRMLPPFGPYKGQVFLWNPGDQSFYATDQRLWSKDPKASARMHSRVDLLLTNGIFSAVRRKQMGLTVRLNRFGKVECKKRASTDGMTVGEVRKIAPNHFRFRLSGAGKNPCTPLLMPTPDIDYDLTVNIVLTSGQKSARVQVAGAVDEFPSFEMYAAVNDDFDRATTLFRREASRDPSDIAGPAGRKIAVNRVITPR